MSKDVVKVKVHGLKELDKALNALDLDLRTKAAREAGRNAMRPVLEAARQNVPVDTGALKSGIKLSATTAPSRLAKTKGKKVSMIASVYISGKGRKFKGVAVEYGNSRRAATPFLRPAIRGREKTVFMLFRKHLKNSIIKQAKKQSRRTR